MSEPIAQTVTLHRPLRHTPAKAEQRWSVEQILALFDLPFAELLHRAQAVHREHFGKPSRERLVLAEGELLGLAEGLEIKGYSEGWRENGRHTARLVARRL